MGDCRELWATHEDCARSRGMIQPAAADRFPNLLHWILRGPSPSSRHRPEAVHLRRPARIVSIDGADLVIEQQDPESGHARFSMRCVL
jgi:hypothetical protein